MGIGETSVYNYLKAAGVSRRAIQVRLESLTMLRSAGCTRMACIGIRNPTPNGCDESFTHSIRYWDVMSVPVRLQRHRLDDPTVKAEVIALRAEGFTYGEIAKKMGINRNYIGQVLREDVKIARKERWREEVVVRRSMSVHEMRENGLTIDEIAEITGKSRVTVFQELH